MGFKVQGFETLSPEPVRVGSLTWVYSGLLRAFSRLKPMSRVTQDVAIDFAASLQPLHGKSKNQNAVVCRVSGPEISIFNALVRAKMLMPSLCFEMNHNTET